MALAENMYFDPENPEYVHPNAQEMFNVHILHLDSYTRMKLNMKSMHKQEED